MCVRRTIGRCPRPTSQKKLYLRRAMQLQHISCMQNVYVRYVCRDTGSRRERAELAHRCTAAASKSPANTTCPGSSKREAGVSSQECTYVERSLRRSTISRCLCTQACARGEPQLTAWATCGGHGRAPRQTRNWGTSRHAGATR